MSTIDEPVTLKQPRSMKLMCSGLALFMNFQGSNANIGLLWMNRNVFLFSTGDAKFLIYDQ